MEIIDVSIVSIIIPQLLVALNTNLDRIAMVTTFYVIAAAMFNPLTGFVIQKFTFKKVILCSALFFGVFSAFCGLATSLYEMMFFRFFQGLGGAFLPSTAQAYISQNFEGEEQNRMMTIFSSTLVLGPILGPVLGAYLTADFNWRFVFYINIPICVVGVMMVILLMPKTKPKKVHFDKPSFFYLCLGIGLLEYFIDQGHEKYWFHSTQMIWMFFFSIVFLILFIHRGINYKAVLNLKLFKYKNFVLISIFVYLFFMTSTIFFAYVPTLIQKIYGYPIKTVGLLYLPTGLTFIMFVPIIKLCIKKIGYRETIFCGFLILICCCSLFTHLGMSTTIISLIFIMGLQGIGMLFVLLPLLEICFVSIPVELQGEASGVVNFFRNIASSTGTAIASSFLSHRLNADYIQLRGFVNPLSSGYQSWTNYLKGFSELEQLNIANLEVLKSALLQAFHSLYIICAILYIFILYFPFILNVPEASSSYLRIFYSRFSMVKNER